MEPSTRKSNIMDNRRRKYLIDPRCQWIYIFRLLVLEILVAVPCVLLTAYVTVLVVRAGGEGEAYWMKLLAFVSFLCLIVSAILVWFGIRMSHRIFGPIYRFQMVFARAAETGEIPHDIRLRPNDEFKGLVDSINRYFRRLREERGD